MCWIGKDNRQIAKDDIKVFKIVIGHKKLSFFNSVYQKFLYEIGSVYSSKIKKRQISDSAQIQISNGIHSYSLSCKIFTFEDIVSIRERKNNGILDIFSKRSLFNEYHFYKLECIIPKKSAYYENDLGEIVSSRLKILKAERL